jgi:hypothetical protein
VIQFDVDLHIPEVTTPVDNLREKKRIPEFSSVFHRLRGLPLSSLGALPGLLVRGVGQCPRARMGEKGKSLGFKTGANSGRGVRRAFKRQRRTFFEKKGRWKTTGLQEGISSEITS